MSSATAWGSQRAGRIAEPHFRRGAARAERQRPGPGRLRGLRQQCGFLDPVDDQLICCRRRHLLFRHLLPLPSCRPSAWGSAGRDQQAHDGGPPVRGDLQFRSQSDRGHGRGRPGQTHLGVVPGQDAEGICSRCRGGRASVRCSRPSRAPPAGGTQRPAPASAPGPVRGPLWAGRAAAFRRGQLCRQALRLPGRKLDPGLRAPAT